MATSWAGAGLSPWDLIRHTHHVYVKERSNILSLFHLSQHISYSKKNVLFIVSVFESRVEYENRGETKKQASQGQRTVFIFSAVCYTYVGKRKEKNRF